jgi:hypothetical protein
MNSNPHNSTTSESGEETLRLIAGLPAPAGLEERVHESLRHAPRMGRVVAWPAGVRSKFSPENNWMRAAAAAAIVFVVVGGGWGVYTRVQQNQTGRVVVMPLRAPSSGSFSGAGAIRTPVTLPGPKIREQNGREQGTEGARQQGIPAAKKTTVPKKPGPQPAPSRNAPSQSAQHPAVTR